jgi:hypothetical protein
MYTFEQRSLAFAEKFAVNADGCWLWAGAHDPEGYGHFWNGQRAVVAHRWAYESFVGPVPSDLELDHLCRVRDCVNPDHLEAVSHRENSLRGVGQSAIHAGKTHCDNGHPFDQANTYVWDGRRFCRACNRATQARCRREDE